MGSILPSQAVSTSTGTRTDGTPQTAALSRISDFGSLVTRSGQPTRTNADDLLTEDGELDSLDEGLHAFREPSVYRTSSNQGQGALLPTHDGLGMFPASSTPVQDQLWQHEQYNPKRKYEGGHVRRSSLQRRLDSIEVLDLQINEEKRMRIEQWRFEQSQVLLDEIQRETRRRERDRSIGTRSSPTNLEADIDLLGTTPKQKDIASLSPQETEEVEPFWRRVTRKFIRDVIGIDEPLLSIIVGETLPEDMHSITNLVGASEAGPHQASFLDETWPDRLLHRIARELGLLVNKLSPHPGAFAAASSFLPPDYAGIPISERPSGKADESRDHDPESASRIAPLFSPTMHDPIHNASWGLEDGPIEESNDATRLRLEREYWERELDIKMVFRFLNSRFSSSSSPPLPPQAPKTQPLTSSHPQRRTDRPRPPPFASTSSASITRSSRPEPASISISISPPSRACATTPVSAR